MILLLNAIKIFAVAKLRQPVEVLKSRNDRQSHILLKFKEPKEPIQFELSYVDNKRQAIQKSCIDRKSNEIINDQQSEFRESSELINLNWSIWTDQLTKS